MAALRSIQQQLQDSVTEYRQMQQEVSSVVGQQMKLQQQVNETSMVQQELEMLGDGGDAGAGTVYKLVGPLLVRQDTYEAKANVNKRLEFIKKEMYAPPTPVRPAGGQSISRNAQGGLRPPCAFPDMCAPQRRLAETASRRPG